MQRTCSSSLHGSEAPESTRHACSRRRIHGYVAQTRAVLMERAIRSTCSLEQAHLADVEASSPRSTRSRSDSSASTTSVSRTFGGRYSSNAIEQFLAGRHPRSDGRLRQGTTLRRIGEMHEVTEVSNCAAYSVCRLCFNSVLRMAADEGGVEVLNDLRKGVEGHRCC